MASNYDSTSEFWQQATNYLEALSEGLPLPELPSHPKGPEQARMLASLSRLEQRLAHQVDEQLNQQRSVYENIMGRLPIDLAIFDRHFRYLYVNPTAVADPQIRDFLIGKTDEDWARLRNIDPAIIRERIKGYRQVLDTKRPATMEQQHVDARGNVRHYYRSLTPLLDQTGEIQYIVGMGLEVTDIKAKETELQARNEALIKANHELDHFVYRASHDLRSPLASMLGLLSLASAEPDVDVRSRYLDMVSFSVRKLDFIIREIVDYSQNARLSIEPETLNLAAMVSEILDSLAFLEKHQKIEFIVDIQEESPVVADRLRVHIVLNTLLSNAIKFHDLNAEKGWVRVQIQSDPDWLCISVEDNGPGIEDDILPKIYDMFFRGNNAAFGAGMGLYIMQEAVGQMGGTHHLDSRPGKGSLFSVKIPNLHQPD